MVLKVFTIYDSKVGAFKAPFLAQSKGQALRDWTDAVNDPKMAFHKHPEDYTLFELGEYDDQTGQYHNLVAPLSIAPAVEVKFGDLQQTQPHPIEKVIERMGGQQ